MLMVPAAALAGLLIIATLPAAAQPAAPSTTPSPPVDAPATPATTAPASPAPSSPRPLPNSVAREGRAIHVSATLGANGPAIRSGITWRLYMDPQDGTPPVLLQSSQAGTPSFQVGPGVYIIHATFGLASAMKRVVMGEAAATESLVLNAGALVLSGIIGDTPIAADKLRFNIYLPVGNDPQGRTVAENAHANALIRLPEGTYRVVSVYGDSNAMATADLKVEAGQVLEAVMRHKAATVTLKLVTSPGSEALAKTAFSVLTPGGDTIREAIGAFPSMTLAEGDYIAIARNGGKVYTQEFQVKAGLDRDIEVIAKEQPPAP